MKHVFFLVVCSFQFIGLSQVDDPIKKFEMLWKQGRLDSVDISIKTYTKNIYFPDTLKSLYVFKDTIVDSSGGYEIGMSILDPFWSMSKVQYGEWKTYYPNDSIKSVGYYSVGATYWCQFSGPSNIGYSFKSGEWVCYYENSKKMAIGNYITVPEEWDNNCGVDAFFINQLDDDWVYWNELGKEIQLTEKIKKLID